MKETPKLAEAILQLVGALALGPILILVSSVYYGWAFAILWRWFIVPTLGMPALTIGQSAGLALVVGALVHRADLKPDYAGWELVGRSLARPLILLGCGWLYKLAFGV